NQKCCKRGTNAEPTRPLHNQKYNDEPSEIRCLGRPGAGMRHRQCSLYPGQAATAICLKNDTARRG
ncbi:hypothetical protein A2U01_0063621, partial [Trifolium medium]|nr:hypothetical protein [Trifolium medium]